MSDESDSEEHYYSGSDQGDEGDESHESDSDDDNHGLLDLEASEGSSDPESDADQFSDGGSYTEYSFPKFMQLPPEIREMVWAAFCPDLGPEPRVFELHLHTVISPPGAVHLPMLVHGIVAGPHLESQTAPMRAVMAVHRESRALGLKSAPNELSLSRGEVVHYHEERDVLFVQWDDEILLRGIALRFQELGIEAQNLAFPSDLGKNYADDLVDFMYLLPQTRRVFILDDEDDLLRDQDYYWAVAEMVHKYRLDAEEEGPTGLADQISRLFCWPDLDNNREFAEEHVTELDGDSPWWTTTECRRRLQAPLENSQELNDDDLPDEEKTEAVERLQKIEVWPMIRFNFEDGLDRFEGLDYNGRPTPVKWEDYSSVTSADMYESDGIYDGPLDDSSSIDDEDTTLVSIAQNLAQRLFPRPSNQLFDNSSEIDELPSANFSSDEEIEDQDPVVINSDSEDESASQTRATRPKRRVVVSDSDESETEMDESPQPSKRRSLIAISDSVDDEDEGSSDAAEPVRRANRRARAIPIDSEDEEGQDDDTDMPQPSRADRRRARAVPVDSDEEEDEEEEGVQAPSGGRKSRGRVVQEHFDEDDDDESDSQGGGVKTKDPGSSDDEEQSSSDDEEDEPPPPKRMSLAKRLRMESKQSKQARPRQPHDDDDSEADGVNGDGYGYSDDQEDEVDNSDGDMGTGLAEFYKGDDYESD